MPPAYPAQVRATVFTHEPAGSGRRGLGLLRPDDRRTRRVSSRRPAGGAARREATTRLLVVDRPPPPGATPHSGEDPEDGSAVPPEGPHLCHTWKGGVWGYATRFPKRQSVRISSRSVS